MTLAWASGPAGKGEPPAVYGALRAAVEKALQDRGFRFSDDAPAIISAGFAERPASISLEGTAGRMLSDGKKQRLLQNCQDRMMRVRIAVIDRARGEKPDLLVVNRFGRLESEGAGMIAEIGAAVAEGEAVLIAVPLRYADAWNAFADGLDAQIRPEISELDRWWRAAGRQSASA